jgi:Arc/MetJ-type ribon-helix-helix transcriptional regulator
MTVLSKTAIIFKYYLVLPSNMQTITLKVDEAFAKEIQKAMHPHYSTKTEFIREAIREKLLSMQERLAGLARLKNTVPGTLMSKEEQFQIAKDFIKTKGWKIQGFE